MFPALAITFTWVTGTGTGTGNQGSASKDNMGLTILGTIGQTGPILGGQVISLGKKPLCGYVLLSFLPLPCLLLVLGLWLIYGTRTAVATASTGPAIDHVPVEIADTGDAHLMYRYIIL